MSALSMTAVVGEHRMGWLVFCTWSRCSLRSRPEVHTSLRGHQEPAWSQAVNFMGYQLCILHSCRGLKGSRGHHAANSYQSVAEGSMNLDVSFCCPCHKLRRHSCFPWLHFLPLLSCLLPGQWPGCWRLLLSEEDFLCQDSSHWRASNGEYKPLSLLSVIRMCAQHCINATDANYICCI